MSNLNTYCGQEVQRHDNDRFLTVLFAPADKKAGLLALYGFNLEIARIRESVRETAMGRIRFQWWRDSLADLYDGKIRAHAVLQELAPLTSLIKHADLETILNAREIDLEELGPETMEDLQEYARRTGGVLMRLAAQILLHRHPGEGRDPLLASAENLGTGTALIGLIRAIPFHARHGRTYLPAELSPDIAVKTIYKTAFSLLSGKAQTPRSALAALLPAALVKHYARILKANHFDPATPKLQHPHPARMVWLMKAWLLARP